MKKICLCVGTRPNFIKAAPLIRAFKKHDVPYRLVHTDQHYDYNMAGIFFKELDIPKPDVSLCIIPKDNCAITQIAGIMHSFQEDCIEHNPDIIIVLGDVNSSLACALTAKLMGIKLAHVEAGERCGYPNMAEEINRRLIDQISDYLFCSSETGYRNFIREEKGYDNYSRKGILGGNFYLVGNTMIDQLKHIQFLLGGTKKDDKESYAVLTLHRAENVDDLKKLRKTWDIILKISEKIKVVFPCHPRTKKQLEKIGILPASEGNDRFLFAKPMSYVEFMKLIYQAKFVLTDSGGLQMETSYLNIPCITLRESTEWLETVASGTNVVTGIYEDDIMNAVGKIFANKWKESKIHYNPLYDSNAADRIVEILRTL